MTKRGGSKTAAKLAKGEAGADVLQGFGDPPGPDAQMLALRLLSRRSYRRAVWLHPDRPKRPKRSRGTKRVRLDRTFTKEGETMVKQKRKARRRASLPKRAAKQESNPVLKAIKKRGKNKGDPLELQG